MSELQALLIKYKDYYPCLNLSIESMDWHCGIDNAPNINKDERNYKNRIHVHAGTPLEAFLKAISVLKGGNSIDTSN